MELVCENISFGYTRRTPVIREFSHVFRTGITVLKGYSGSGKTTLLNILGGMDTLSTGKVVLDGQEISALNKKQLTDYRRHDVGFVFQFYNLIGNLTALENVELANQICKNPLDKRYRARS